MCCFLLSTDNILKMFSPVSGEAFGITKQKNTALPATAQAKAWLGKHPRRTRRTATLCVWHKGDLRENHPLVLRGGTAAAPPHPGNTHQQ